MSAGFAVAGAPRQHLAARRYRAAATGYDILTAAGQAYRDWTVDRLAPARGAVVLDVGCGTGLNFERLQAVIGPHGRLVGIDLSPEMLACARERVERHGWRNVTLIEAAADDAAIPVRADAALLCGVHDIMRSPAALAHVVGRVRSGGRVVAGGPKWVPWWRPGSLAMNAYIWQLHRDYVTTFEGFEAPWNHLVGLLGGLEVEEVFLGGGYIAAGTRPATSSRSSPRSPRRQGETSSARSTR